MSPHHDLTTREVASLVGVLEANVRRRAGIERYVQGTRVPVGGGRPTKVYSPEVLKLWLHDLEAPTDLKEPLTPKPKRKRRADVGAPRKCSPELWRAIVGRVYGLYMGNAQQNLRLACEEAVRQFAAEGIEIDFHVYRRLFDKRTDKHTGEYLSPFWAEKWRTVHASKWKRKDLTQESESGHYDWLKVFESAGWAGKGFGAGRVWAIDGRSSDHWARTSDSKNPRDMVFPNALYIRDGLTGYPLWIEPIETESSEAVMSALLKCALYWRMCPDIAIALDGGIANSATNTVGVISHMLPRDAWDRATQYPELFGVTGSPILRNIPNIPSSPFKAGLERGNRQIKDEYDATRFAHSYQGGNRSEAVQLRVSNQPTVSAKTPMLADYFEGFKEWMYGDYIRRERPAMYPALVERGITPTMENAFRYYGGYDGPERLPYDERLAYILYYYTLGKKDQQGVVRVKGAKARATINGEWWPVACTGITHQHDGEKVAIVPIPGDNLHAVVMYLRGGDRDQPSFLGIGVNAYVQDMAMMGYQKQAVINARSAYNAGLREAREAVPDAEWKNHTTPDVIPDDRQIAGWTPGTERAVKATDQHLLTAPTSPEEGIDDDEIDDDTFELLREINSR